MVRLCFPFCIQTPGLGRLKRPSGEDMFSSRLLQEGFSMLVEAVSVVQKVNIGWTYIRFSWSSVARRLALIYSMTLFCLESSLISGRLCGRADAHGA